MSERRYLKGNEAIAYGALEAGLNAYFAYPITPSSEIPETLAKEYGSGRYPRFKAYLQAASEIEAINMVLGAGSAGARAMTATSGPGFSLMQESISHGAGLEVPFVVVNIMRVGPGTGNIGPEQGDYFQMTKGGGHGNYRVIVLAPNSVQEMASFPGLAFDLAFKYRIPVIIAGDAFTGQLKEDVEFPEVTPFEYDTSWATVGARGPERHILRTIELDYEKHWENISRLKMKYELIEEKEVRYEDYLTEDAECVVVAYGIASRIAKAAVNKARAQGLKAGLLRPITLWPFPRQQIRSLAKQGKAFLVVELSIGQLVEDVELAAGGLSPVGFLGKWGGLLPNEDEILEKVMEMSLA